MPFAELAQVTIAYETLGAKDDPAIILIRGLGTQLIEWPASLLDGLVAAGFRVVIFDNRDCGLSTKLDDARADPPYRLEDMAGDVVGLADHLGIQRLHVLGISLGGAVAQHVALGYPQRVASLVSVMSTTSNPDLPPMPPEQRSLLTRVPESIEEAIAFDAEGREAWGSPGFPVRAEVRLAAARRAAERSYCPEGTERQLKAFLADGSRCARLAGLTVPTLVIHGGDDVLIPPEAGRDTARCIPGATFEVVPGMGHEVPPGLGAWLAARVAAFVQALE